MRKAILVFLAVLTALSCIACAGNTPSVNKPMPTSPVQNPGTTEPKETETPTDPQATEDITPVLPQDDGYSLEVAKWHQKCSIFVLRNDRFYPADSVALDFHPEAAYHRDFDTIGMTFVDNQNPVVINLQQGDLLVTFREETQYDLQLVESKRYCLPIPVFIDDAGLRFEKDDMILNCGYKDKTTELNGFEVTNKSVFNKINGCSLWEVSERRVDYSFISSDSPMNLKAGYYRGTQWVEYDLEIDALTYYFPNKKTVNVQKTKEGYFIIDLSSVSAGQYVIKDSKNYKYNKYVLEVR